MYDVKNNKKRTNLMYHLIINFVVLCIVFSYNTICWSKNHDFDAWKQDFRQQAITSGISTQFIDSILPKMALLPQVVAADKKQPEFHLTFWNYTDRALSEKRLRYGRKMLHQHRDMLDRAEKKYNVPAKYIVAFWGLETSYGQYKGNINTLNALTTLAYDKRRRRFFTKELLAFLRILQSDKLENVTGSWAGAFGNFQFMPTTFEAYAVDADGDGKRDLINSLPDAIESAANYLSQMGWDNTVKWGREVKITKQLQWDNIHQKRIRSIKEWKELGIEPANGTEWPKTSEHVMARLVMPMGINGPIFLGYKNYDITMRWNRSKSYALSVGLLSDALILGEYQVYAPRQEIKFSYQQIKNIQELLTKKGYYKGRIDGQLGSGTKQSIRQWQKELGLPQDGYINDKLINEINGLK